MRESNDRSSDLQSKVQENERIKWEIAWLLKILEKESKNYKYAQSEREAGHLPRNKHEATLCCSQIWALAAILEKLDDTRENLLIQQRRRGEQLDLSC